MSYDLMVFDPAAVPDGHAQFLDWYGQQIKWSEGHTYNDPGVSTPELRAWFMDMIVLFPSMNGPISQDQLPEDEASMTDYSLGKSVIYCAFAWSKEQQAYATVFDLAQKHGLGFFDVSSESEEVWLPLGGQLRIVYSK